MTIAIVIQIRPGTPLATAAEEAIALSQQLNTPVKTIFQGVEMYCTPTDTVQTLSDRYQALLTPYQAFRDRIAAIKRRVPRP